MPVHDEQRFVPFSPEQMFAMVADVARYPEFLPWCAGARIRTRERIDGVDRMTADLIVAYKVFRERFASRVTLDEVGGRIEVEYLDGPFTHLVNRWSFHPYTDEMGVAGSKVGFFVDFAFKSKTLQKIIESRFAEAVIKMGDAFEARAHEIYTPVQVMPTPEPVAGS
ncbi:MAG: type II toxin-antitoxin system RatA family toxin [Candidatus Phaeomarinobacter sp.]|mgnify:CR=1 FL=1